MSKLKNLQKELCNQHYTEYGMKYDKSVLSTNNQQTD